MYAAPPAKTATRFARLPDTFRKGSRQDCFIEGPAFDRDGNLYVVNIPCGQIIRISPAGEFELVVEYEGEPNGLAIHQDGRIFVADHRNGLMVCDPTAGEIGPVIDRPRRERFKGLNDLTFSSSGDLYFSDQGQSGLQDPMGRLWRWRESTGALDLLLDNIPSPNGLAIAKDESLLYLAVTRANAIWRVPLRRTGGVGRVGVYIQLSGGAGPDGVAVAEDDKLAVAHLGMGSVWVFDERGRPHAEIMSPTGSMVSNVAFGGPERKTLYITESGTGTLLRAEIEVAGKILFSHR
ncbi:MAG: SMP-30/gluconolactonase/LRE family protein [Acetobacteraceae bacterium]|nr:SMP-30/gluconolactonase/LRE family protein [Acetobacteraceae bacterium]